MNTKNTPEKPEIQLCEYESVTAKLRAQIARTGEIVSSLSNRLAPVSMECDEDAKSCGVYPQRTSPMGREIEAMTLDLERQNDFMVGLLDKLVLP